MMSSIATITRCTQHFFEQGRHVEKMINDQVGCDPQHSGVCKRSRCAVHEAWRPGEGKRQKNGEAEGT